MPVRWRSPLRCCAARRPRNCACLLQTSEGPFEASDSASSFFRPGCGPVPHRGLFCPEAGLTGGFYASCAKPRLHAACRAGRGPETGRRALSLYNALAERPTHSGFPLHVAGETAHGRFSPGIRVLAGVFPASCAKAPPAAPDAGRKPGGRRFPRARPQSAHYPCQRGNSQPVSFRWQSPGKAAHTRRADSARGRGRAPSCAGRPRGRRAFDGRRKAREWRASTPVRAISHAMREAPGAPPGALSPQAAEREQAVLGIGLISPLRPRRARPPLRGMRTRRAEGASKRAIKSARQPE